MLLKDLKVGNKAKIVAFRESSPEYRRRLVMLGATPGAELEIIRIAPLGDPIEIRVRGSLISVRKHEADMLELSQLHKQCLSL